MQECPRRKQYVEVVATHHIDGSVRPQKIVLATGPMFEIEDSREAAKGKARTTGEIVRRYVVKIRGKETILYRDGERWFVNKESGTDGAQSFLPDFCLLPGAWRGIVKPEEMKFDEGSPEAWERRILPLI